VTLADGCSNASYACVASASNAVPSGVFAAGTFASTNEVRGVCAAPIEGNVEVGSVSLTPGGPNYGVCLIVYYQSYTFTSGYTVLVDLD
jgi:hypothetical protein